MTPIVTYLNVSQTLMNLFLQFPLPPHKEKELQYREEKGWIYPSLV